MHAFWSIALALSTAGCVSQTALNHAPNPTRPGLPLPAVRAADTRTVATPYTVRSYRDPEDPTVLHDGHTVYRLSRVPDAEANQTILPRTTMAPATYVPLPPSEELAAELATQRQITAELRQIEARVIEVQQQALTEVGKLTDEKAAAVQRQITAGTANHSDALTPADTSASSAAPPAAANW